VRSGPVFNITPPRVHSIDTGAVEDPTSKWRRQLLTEPAGPPRPPRDPLAWVAAELDEHVWRENVVLWAGPYGRRHFAVFDRCYDRARVVVDRFLPPNLRTRAEWREREAIARANGYLRFAINRRTGIPVGRLAGWIQERSRTWDRTD
jgi:hypothetical protein